MGTGFVKVIATSAEGALPVVGAQVTILSGETVLYQLPTDESGITDAVPVEAPAVALTLDENFEGLPYSKIDVKVQADGFATAIVHGVEVLDTETSLVPINMLPANAGEVLEYDTPEHNLVSEESRQMERPGEFTPPRARVLSEVVIPEFITVHLGRPDNPNARNVRVPFTYYIKNSASHEIFSTWPPASLEANIYCIISLTLNRIFTNTHRLGRQEKRREYRACW